MCSFPYYSHRSVLKMRWAQHRRQCLCFTCRRHLYRLRVPMVFCRSRFFSVARKYVLPLCKEILRLIYLLASANPDADNSNDKFLYGVVGAGCESGPISTFSCSSASVTSSPVNCSPMMFGALLTDSRSLPSTISRHPLQK